MIMVMKRIDILKMFFVCFGFLLLASCGSNDSESGMNANFTFDYTDGNHVEFKNESEGEYYSMEWDFGNDETPVTTTDKNKSFSIYYPVEGEYNVTLTLFGFTGDKAEVSKIISISNTNFEISFSAEIDPTNPNNVVLANTTIGNYDSFKWVYRNIEIDNEENTIAYFPKSGQYEIELIVTVGNDTFSTKQTITIIQDDPNYVDNMTLVWSDEFDGTSVNTDYWTFETGDGGWGNNELQNYTNGDNAEVTDGKLIITAKKVNDDKVAGSYTSTRLISKGKKEFTYGRYEIRAKLPSGTGIWPAIWMLGSNLNTAGWPACGEIDIMEYIGYQPDVVHATVHTTAGSGSNGDGSSKTLTTAEEEFHIYGLLWDKTEMVFYIDTPDNVTHTYAPSTKTASNWPFNEDQFFILNVAVGGNWGGAQGIDNAIFPQSMEIDYVRVYQ
ncbi:family 16 glycosylhydrolase [Labilibaculum sp. 44]|uniref:Family 16 glycosylhydrolase n=2 Tax=Labilibaculum euxinus TaxID=2686357 RepID=A0A7M4D632_9BACT|nr:family 16 glycosylhydrolase [Labilibaculum euxinus]MVB07316.1 family 16 glycosylhydrolase [Labilibaculum euxinus]